jgi:hypothetical protein
MICTHRISPGCRSRAGLVNLRQTFVRAANRPAPRAKLNVGRFVRDEKVSSGLPLQPTDLSALLTEQIAHFSPLLETTRAMSSELCRIAAYPTASVRDRPRTRLPNRMFAVLRAYPLLQQRGSLSRRDR